MDLLEIHFHMYWRGVSDNIARDNAMKGREKSFGSPTSNNGNLTDYAITRVQDCRDVSNVPTIVDIAVCTLCAMGI